MLPGAVPDWIPTDVQEELGESEEALRIVACHHGMHTFVDLCRVAATTRALRATVEQSLVPWQHTAQRMRAAGQRLTKTEAQSVLLLSTKDLENVDFDVKSLGYGREAHLYSATELIEAARRKHGAVDGLKRARARRAQRSATRRANVRAKQARAEALRADRRQALEAAMRELDPELAPRSDSRLCRAWIEDGRGSPDEIAKCMLEMRWFHSVPYYKQRIRELQRELREFSGWQLPPDEFRTEMDCISQQAQWDTLRHFDKRGRRAELPPTLRARVEAAEAATRKRKRRNR
jgi:hypothetical protein